MLDDQQLLRRYATDGSEAAFGELVARYVNLVYSAALRRTGGDTHLAQDAAQLVFTDLARKARSLPKNVVLAGWLHRATQYAAAQLLRTEHRRQAREQEAVAMNTPDSESAPDWDRIQPLLDKALDELNPTDRDALLLRFFEQRSLAEVGQALGSNEDAARKRVTRALDKLRTDLIRRGVGTTAAVLSTVLSVNAIQVAPAGLAATLTSASLVGAAAGTAIAGATSLMTMTTLKIGLVSATVAAAVMAVPLVIQHQAQTRLRGENETLRQQAAQLNQSATENVAASPTASTSSSPALSNELFSELLRLRGEVTRLRQDSQELARLKAGNATTAGDSMTAEVNSWLARVNELKQKLDQRPDLKIPELQFLTPRDWLNVARDARPDTDAGARLAFNYLRAAGKQAFSPTLLRALNSYVQASGGQLPAEVADLKPYFNPPVDDALLDRYQLVRTGKASDVPAQDPAVITEKAQVDADFDSLLNVGLNSASLKGEGGGSGFGFSSSSSRAFSSGGGTNSSGGNGSGGGSGGRVGSVSFGSGPGWTNVTLTPR